MMYWAAPDTAGASMPGVASSTVTALPGFPTRDEARERYAERSGRDLSNLDFYIVLGHFKLAVILNTMPPVSLPGAAWGPGLEVMGKQVLVLPRRGLAIADRSSMAALRG